jgi:hypothetical protein
MSSIRLHNKEILRGTPFEGMSSDELREHLDRERYDDFWLTDAVRPSPTLVPIEGYRFGWYRAPESDVTIPVITAAASREKLFDLFLSLAEPLGDMVDAVLQSSHEDEYRRSARETECDDLENMILRSRLYDFEDLLLHDGCSGIAVLNSETPAEVQFDEHKLFHIYGKDHETLYPYEEILQDAGLRLRKRMRIITEEPHVHSSREEFRHRFNELKILLSGDGDF